MAMGVIFPRDHQCRHSRQLAIAPSPRFILRQDPQTITATIIEEVVIENTMERRQNLS